MKIVLIIYIISWVILLGVYISHLFSKNKSSSSDKTPWYIYATMIVLAPLAVLILPYIIYSNYKDKKVEKKLKEEREAKKRMKEERKVSAKAAFHSALHSNADYASIGSKLHKLVQDKKYNAILGCLDKITLPDGAELMVKECDNGTSDIGDKSTLLVKFTNGETDENIFNHLVVEQSAIGAWQAYLLHKLWHVLPLFWHANYDARDYIFQKDDASKISVYTNDKRERNAIIALISDIDFTPDVRENSGKFYVSSCYWSNFGGLIREYFELTFNGNKVTNLYQFDSKTLYKYNCGILF